VSLRPLPRASEAGQGRTRRVVAGPRAWYDAINGRAQLCVPFGIGALSHDVRFRTRGRTNAFKNALTKYARRLRAIIPRLVEIRDAENARNYVLIPKQRPTGGYSVVHRPNRPYGMGRGWENLSILAGDRERGQFCTMVATEFRAMRWNIQRD